MAAREDTIPDTEGPADVGPGAERWGWRRILGTLGSLFLGGVFLVAVWGKMFDPGVFAEVIELEGLSFGLSADLVAWGVLTLEAAIGFALVLLLRRMWVLIPTLLLVLFFIYHTGLSYVGYLQGEPPASASCGCFGSLWDRTPAEAFWYDVLLMVPALVLAFFGRLRGAFPRIRSGIVAVLTVAVGVFVYLAPDLPLDDFATRLHPDANVKDICAGSGEDRTCLFLLAADPTVLEGRRICVIAKLDDEAFIQQINDRADALWDREDEGEPRILVLHAGEKEDHATFGHKVFGAPLEFLIAPATLLRTMYRTLPRTFLLTDGMVVRTWTGFPALSELESDQAR